MFFELIATVVAGATVYIIIMAFNRLIRGALPRWLQPVSAGLAMLAFTIWSEYNWFDRTTANLPEGIEVVTTVEQNGGWRFWTRYYPYIQRFAAVDQRSTRVNPDNAALRITNVVLFGRWQTVSQVPVMVDCAGKRQADLPENAIFNADGTVSGVQWRMVAADDPILVATCKEG